MKTFFAGGALALDLKRATILVEEKEEGKRKCWWIDGFGFRV